MKLFRQFLIFTGSKRSLGQGNAFTPVGRSVHKRGSLSRGGGPSRKRIPIQGVPVQGGLCSRGSLSRSVSVRETPTVR